MSHNRDNRRKCVAQENEAPQSKQNNPGQVEQNRTPPTLIEKLLLRRIERAEVQKEGWKKNEGSIAEKLYGQIQIPITADWYVKKEDKSRQAPGCEVQS